jgi:hypothetical protein
MTTLEVVSNFITTIDLHNKIRHVIPPLWSTISHLQQHTSKHSLFKDKCPTKFVQYIEPQINVTSIKLKISIETNNVGAN